MTPEETGGTTPPLQRSWGFDIGRLWAEFDYDAGRRDLDVLWNADDGCCTLMLTLGPVGVAVGRAARR